MVYSMSYLKYEIIYKGHLVQERKHLNTVYLWRACISNYLQVKCVINNMDIKQDMDNRNPVLVFTLERYIISRYFFGVPQFWNIPIQLVDVCLSVIGFLVLWFVVEPAEPVGRSLLDAPFLFHLFLELVPTWLMTTRKKHVWNHTREKHPRSPSFTPKKRCDKA